MLIWTSRWAPCLSPESRTFGDVFFSTGLKYESPGMLFWVIHVFCSAIILEFSISLANGFLQIDMSKSKNNNRAIVVRQRPQVLNSKVSAETKIWIAQTTSQEINNSGPSSRKRPGKYDSGATDMVIIWMSKWARMMLIWTDGKTRAKLNFPGGS